MSVGEGSVCGGSFQNFRNFLLGRLFLQFQLLQLGFEIPVPWCETLILQNALASAVLLPGPAGVACMGEPG